MTLDDLALGAYIAGCGALVVLVLIFCVQYTLGSYRKAKKAVEAPVSPERSHNWVQAPNGLPYCTNCRTDDPGAIELWCPGIREPQRYICDGHRAKERNPSMVVRDCKCYTTWKEI